MANRYNRIDGTAPITDVAEMTRPNVPSSVFDYSCTKYGTTQIGALIPIDVMETIPGETYDINYNAMIEISNPLVRKLFNGYTAYIHTYYNRMSDLWEGAKNFIDRGRSGTITGQIPRMATRLEYIGDTHTEIVVEPQSVGGLLDYLGVQPRIYKPMAPIEGYNGVYNYNNNNYGYYRETDPEHGQYTATIINDGAQYTTQAPVNALIPFMYQRIWRDKYAPKNLLQNNKNLFPDNEDHFIIPYSAGTCYCIDYTNNMLTESIIDRTQEAEKQAILLTTKRSDISATEEKWQNSSTNNEAYFDITNQRYFIDSEDTKAIIALDALRFRQFKGDVYTTASPFENMIRGDTPKLGNLRSNYNHTWVPTYIGLDTTNKAQATPTGSNNQYTLTGDKNETQKQYIYGLLTDTNEKAILNQITMNTIRALEAYTIFAERMARTNGDYNEMIYSQFGYNPNTPTREAKYIGGFKMDMIFNTISQTSESSSESALGTQTQQGVGSGGTTYKRFTAPDYGYIMSIMSIVPDTVYAQGIEKHMSKANQSEMYFPIFNNLGPEAILNKELYLTGDVQHGNTEANKPYGYAERGYQYKARENRAYGLLRLDHETNDEFASRIQARRFTETPVLNNSFTSMDYKNIDKNIFSSTMDPQFTYAIQSNVKKRSPMPYVTEPAGLNPSAV